MEKHTIKFRPHHFLCTLCFQGKGYSPSFVENYQAISARLKAPTGDQEVIHITAQSDSICAPCPHNQGKQCTTEEKIATLDHNHAEALDVKVGEKISWGAAKQKIAENISLEKFHTICAPCQWKPLGICEQVLTEFKNPPYPPFPKGGISRLN